MSQSQLFILQSQGMLQVEYATFSNVPSLVAMAGALRERVIGTLVRDTRAYGNLKNGLRRS